MKKSPVYPKHEGSGDCGVGYEFDPQVDFSQFLEEARQHARTMNLNNSTEELEPGKGSFSRRPAEDKKSKKSSWMKSLFKWWKKSDPKKSASSPRESENSSHIAIPRKGHVSGPVYSTSQPLNTKNRRQTSGPLTNLFNSTKRLGKETPYMNLDNQPNHPDGAKPYGPVYFVT
ncbi:hypothetical protein M5689_020290 [Euphorbia peplus]|nr:hypothetical protein M5689_020290 [Euphorbia peplus]